ncbi:hypothetical protein V8G54_009950 [Vigna mungo]|uniref:Non-specific lipid-transfer protein n=1 Tax=Vigna mungo TaxID=3915 RepID=A0AAQ3S5C2_VIGMU
MASLKVACMVAVVFMVVVSAHMAHAITCGQVGSYVAPCIGYLQKGGNPSGPCCNGVKNLNNAAKTTADRQATCKCLKVLASSASGVNAGNAASLPKKCQVNVPYTISTSTNCNTYVQLSSHISFTNSLITLITLINSHTHIPLLNIVTLDHNYTLSNISPHISRKKKTFLQLDVGEEING